jgi:hypothetical protein
VAPGDFDGEPVTAIGWSHFGLKIARDSIEVAGTPTGWGTSWIEGLAMGIGHPPRNRKNRRRGDNNVVPRRRPDDDFFDVLSPLLEEAATVKGDESPRQGLPSVRSLSKENARLRALAVGLSNLLGDLPVRRWEDAARCCRNKA